MRNKSDDTFTTILLAILLGGLVLGSLWHHCSVTSECEQKRCERGSPMVVRDQAKIVGFEECVCVERPR